MWRRGDFKYHYYVDYPPELFNVASDPGETCDLAGDPSHREKLAEFEAHLRAIVDPEAADRRAKADQKALIEQHGGFDAVRNIGAKNAVPPPDLSDEN